MLTKHGSRRSRRNVNKILLSLFVLRIKVIVNDIYIGRQALVLYKNIFAFINRDLQVRREIELISISNKNFLYVVDRILNTKVENFHVWSILKFYLQISVEIERKFK